MALMIAPSKKGIFISAIFFYNLNLNYKSKMKKGEEKYKFNVHSTTTVILIIDEPCELTASHV